VSTILAGLTAVSLCSPTTPALGIQVDSGRREVVLRSVPVELPALEGDHGEAYHHGPVTPLTPFAWPVEGWARGFHLRLLDCEGKELSRSRLHHVLVLHLERRELMLPIWQRLIAFGPETENLTLPRGVGVRIGKGAELALLAAWVPVEPRPEKVVLELRIPWLAANTNPRPADVVPVGFDVRYEPGEGASYDLPPGPSVRTRTFAMPIDGRLLVAGGHLHRNATGMALVEVESGKAIIRLEPKAGAHGEFAGVERKLFGVTGRGLRLKAGREYRLEVRYDNPTGRILSNSAMGILGGILLPDDLRRWPPLDASSAGFGRDVAMLARTGFIRGNGAP
jgi:hypothetical protein